MKQGNKIFNKIELFRLGISYKLSEMNNVYSHRAVSQKQNINGRTIILYSILGKRHIYDISIEQLMENKSLLERFHPCQAVKFGAIALGDALFSLPIEKREQHYNKIKHLMLESDETNESKMLSEKQRSE